LLWTRPCNYSKKKKKKKKKQILKKKKKIEKKTKKIIKKKKKKKVPKEVKKLCILAFSIIFPKALRCCILMPSTIPQSTIIWKSPKAKKIERRKAQKQEKSWS